MLAGLIPSEEGESVKINDVDSLRRKILPVKMYSMEIVF
jgi:hypothetical protein